MLKCITLLCAHRPIHTFCGHTIDQRQELQFTTALFEKCHHIKVSIVDRHVQRSSFGRFFVLSPFNGKTFLARSTKKRTNEPTNERWHKKNIRVLFDRIYWAAWRPAERSSFGNGWWTSDTHNTNGWAKYSKGIGKAVYTVGNEYSSDECNINVSTSQQ